MKGPDKENVRHARGSLDRPFSLRSRRRKIRTDRYWQRSDPVFAIWLRVIDPLLLRLRLLAPGLWPGVVDEVN